MITHDDWVSFNLNKKVDFDGVYGAQCADVVGQYALDVQGIKGIEGIIGAVDFFTKHESRPVQKKFYYAIKYQEGLITPRGAFVIWGTTKDNSFGHVAICDSASQSGLVVLEQDGFNNSTKNVKLGDSQGLKKRTYNYWNILGWLTLKENRVMGKAPPSGAKIAKSDRQAQIGEYWLNDKTNMWMILTKTGFNYL